MPRITINYSDHDDDRRDRERWRVDLTNNTATHDTGLTMVFERDPAMPGVWNSKPTNLEDWQKRQGLPFEELARSLPRLMRLADDVFTLALKNKGK